MRKIIAAVLLLLSGHVAAQTKMRDVWAALPDSIVPLLSENNRLDMIDFVENNMEARVRNVMDGFSVLDTLTADYLRVTLSENTDVQMRLLPVADSLQVLAVVYTARAPQPVSVIEFKDIKDLKDLNAFKMPEAEAFVNLDDGDEAVQQAVRELADLPLIEIKLSPSEATLTLQISDMPLSPESRKALAGKLHSIKYIWDEKTCCFVSCTDVQ